MTEKPRVTITLTEDIAQEVERLKREKFYNQPYAEVFRHVLELGLQTVKDSQSNAGSGENLEEGAEL